jgi:hypothetical protein
MILVWSAISAWTHLKFIPGEFESWKQLIFRHNYNFDADVDPAVGFDGGVLEISFDQGNTFQDILAAGGTFVVGGYDRTIASDRGSSIAGRQAWSGNSGGFVTTAVNPSADFNS